jgi:hypothetical protein
MRTEFVATLLLAACGGAPKTYALLLAAGGQYSTPRGKASDHSKTVIAPLGCKAGVGDACLPSIHKGDIARSADGRAFRVGDPTRAWNCDTHDVKPDFYAVFESDVQLPDGGDQLLVVNGEAPFVVAPGSSAIDFDLDGDGAAEHVVLENRNAALSITNGRTHAVVHVESASGLSIVNLVGAADVRGDGKKLIIFREGHFYRAVGFDGKAFDLGFGCAGA